MSLSKTFYPLSSGSTHQGHSDQKMASDTSPFQDASTQHFGFLSQIIYEICSRHDYSRNEVKGQGDQKKVGDARPSQNASTHQIWDAYLK